MRMVKFPSIEQYNTTVKNLRMHFQYDGKDEDGKAIYNTSKELPTIRFYGTVKLHGCLYENSIVTTEHGSKAIKDILVGDKVLTFNENTGCKELKEVKKVLCQRLNKPWVKIVFDNGNNLICTADHKIFTHNRGYIEAKDILDSDILEITL